MRNPRSGMAERGGIGGGGGVPNKGCVPLG